MRRARVLVHDRPAGLLEEIERGRAYRFSYLEVYSGPPVSLAMPVTGRVFTYQTFPPFFDGLLPEGFLLDSLLRQRKLDRDDDFGQLLAVGEDMVGAVTVEPLE
jgi:serine/threonine-protein kinase HipA